LLFLILLNFPGILITFFSSPLPDPALSEQGSSADGLLQIHGYKQSIEKVKFIAMQFRNNQEHSGFYYVISGNTI
jgi:hypothetical protein